MTNIDIIVKEFWNLVGVADVAKLIATGNNVTDDTLAYLQKGWRGHTSVIGCDDIIKCGDCPMLKECENYIESGTYWSCNTDDTRYLKIQKMIMEIDDDNKKN